MSSQRHHLEQDSYSKIARRPRFYKFIFNVDLSLLQQISLDYYYCSKKKNNNNNNNNNNSPINDVLVCVI